MERVTDPADPQRCKASDGNGQCWVRVEGSDYCRAHAGAYQPPEKGMRQYLLAHAQDPPGWRPSPSTTTSNRSVTRSR